MVSELEVLNFEPYKEFPDLVVNISFILLGLSSTFLTSSIYGSKVKFNFAMGITIPDKSGIRMTDFRKNQESENRTGGLLSRHLSVFWMVT